MRTRPLGLIAVIVAFTMTACSPAYDAQTRDGLHEHVVSVSEASAAGDWQAAIDELDVMTANLAKAREDGKVDGERFDSIVAAMELVRLDLEAAIAAAADEAERQRLIEEQQRLQQQIEDLQTQGDGKPDKGKGKGDKDKDDD